MFDRLDILTRDDNRTRTPPPRTRSDRERQQPRTGHRRESDPRQDKRGIQERIEGALADVGMYRNVSYRDLAESQFGGHPYTARRAVDRMIRDGHMREHQARGPRGGTYRVLTLTEAGARKARDYAVEQGFDKEQRTWSGLVKRGELSHDTAVYRAAGIEQRRLLQQGARIRRVRIDAEMKKQVARATETARATEGRTAAEAARRKAAQDLELPMQQGRVVYPDAQIEYLDVEGRSGRVNVEIASEHYSGRTITAKAQAGFQMHGSGGRIDVRLRRGRQQAGFGRDHLRIRHGDGRGQFPDLVVLMQGAKTWPAYPALSAPLTIMGVERRWFLLSAMLGLAMWNAIDSLLTGGVIFVVLYGAGWLAWREDPDMVEILRASTRFKARYDPGKWAESPWYLLIRGQQ